MQRIKHLISKDSPHNVGPLSLPIIQRTVRTYLSRQCHFSAIDSIRHLNRTLELYDTHFMDSTMAIYVIPNNKTKLYIIYTYNDSNYLQTLVVKRNDPLYKYFARR
jgi:hypothetical protein